MTDALCAENCVGRWYWKTGSLKNDDAVPWEEQSINTCPENFLWEENKTSILTVAPGVYELKCGLFSNKHKPHFDVMINGMKCISKFKKYAFDEGKEMPDSASKYGNKDYGSYYNHLWQENDESKNRITGNCATTFVNLPANSRIYVNYKGEDHAEGFLSMRKI